MAGRASLSAYVLLAASCAWLFWSRSSGRLGGAATGTPPSSAVSPALAEATLDRIEGLRSGQSERPLALGGPELSSIVRYAVPGIIPNGVSDPEVRIEDGSVALTARVATMVFPKLPALRPLLAMLPDTVPVRIEGTIARLGRELLAFQVSRVEAARIPLPDRLIPQVLEALGRRPRKGIPSNALHIPLPVGLDSLYVVGDSLMLVTKR